MPAEKEEELIRKGVEAYKKTSPTGKVPVVSFYGRPSERSANLVDKVYRELGLEFLYWTDTYTDNLPYYTSMPGGKPGESLVMMPYSSDTNEYKFWLGQFGTDDAFSQHAFDAFTTIRDEGLEGKSAYITVALHTRWIGQPGKFQALKKIVKYFTRFNDVWFATREQTARHRIQTHTYQYRE